MQCPKCGWNNPDDAVKCANCFAEMKPAAQAPPPPQPTQQVPPQPYGQQGYQQQPQYGAAPSVPDYLIWSILVTIFCCIPFGVVSIIKAAAANSKKAAGDYYGAQQEANAAKTWLWWGFGIGLAWGLLWGGIEIAGLLFSLGHHGNFPN